MHQATDVNILLHRSPTILLHWALVANKRVPIRGGDSRSSPIIVRRITILFIGFFSNVRNIIFSQHPFWSSTRCSTSSSLLMCSIFSSVVASFNPRSSSSSEGTEISTSLPSFSTGIADSDGTIIGVTRRRWRTSFCGPGRRLLGSWVWERKLSRFQQNRRLNCLYWY